MSRHGLRTQIWVTPSLCSNVEAVSPSLYSTRTKRAMGQGTFPMLQQKHGVDQLTAEEGSSAVGPGLPNLAMFGRGPRSASDTTGFTQIPGRWCTEYYCNAQGGEHQPLQLLAIFLLFGQHLQER